MITAATLENTEYTKKETAISMENHQWPPSVLIFIPASLFVVWLRVDLGCSVGPKLQVVHAFFPCLSSYQCASWVNTPLGSGRSMEGKAPFQIFDSICCHPVGQCEMLAKPSLCAGGNKPTFNGRDGKGTWHRACVREEVTVWGQ